MEELYVADIKIIHLSDVWSSADDRLCTPCVCRWRREYEPEEDCGGFGTGASGKITGCTCIKSLIIKTKFSDFSRIIFINCSMYIRSALLFFTVFYKQVIDLFFKTWQNIYDYILLKHCNFFEKEEHVNWLSLKDVLMY